MVIYLGTTGWSYNHWKGPFYPSSLKKGYLKYYAQYSLLNEINSTFYAIPPEKMVKSWFNATPNNFIFSAKLPRHLTHTSRFRPQPDLLEKFFSRLQGLQHKLHTILIQFPPRFYRAPESVDYLHYILDKCRDMFTGYLVVELRNKTWFQDQKTVDLLQEKKVTLADTTKLTVTPPTFPSSSIYYLRIIGDRQQMPDELLGKRLLDKSQELNQWIVRLKKLNYSYQDIFVLINNRFSGYAINDAITIYKQLTKEKCIVKGFETSEKYQRRRMTLEEFI